MPRTSYETLIGQKRIKVVQNDADRFDVSYGTTERKNLPYGQAATCLGEIIFYALVLKGQIKTPSILDDSEYAQQENIHDDGNALLQTEQGNEGDSDLRAGERRWDGALRTGDQDDVCGEVEPTPAGREDAATNGDV